MIFLGADHRGFKLKEEIKSYLDKNKIKYLDYSPKYKPNDDYPKYAKLVANNVKKSPKNKGILICGSGQGITIAANKIKGIRAALAWNTKTAKLARQDDNANILGLSGNFTKPTEAKKMVNIFLKTKFSNLARHKRRLNQVKKLE